MNNIETVHRPRLAPVRRIATVVALCALVATLTATWLSSAPASATPPRAAPASSAKASAAATPPDDGESAKSKSKKAIAGKLNLNTATSEQLQLLPGVGPSKAERIVTWRKKNGAFKRVADLRKVKGFGYKTLKKLEPYLDIKGDTTLK